MSIQKEKLEKIQELNESAFRAEVIIPLLKKMKYEKIRETHGPDELGKDIVFYEPSVLGGFHSAVVAKVGNISGAASGEKNLEIVTRQVEMAFENPFFSIEDKQNYQVNKVIVWTTGTISGSAQRQIQNQVAKFRNVTFFDGQKTIELLENFYPAFFTFNDLTISDYYYAVREHYSRIEELRSLGGSIENHRLPIIFVPPKFSSMGERRVDSDKSFKETITRKPTEISFNELLKFKKNYLIIGSAGSGKSTLLRHILISIINKNELKMSRFPLPVIIDAKKIDWEDDKCIEETLYDVLNSYSKFEDDFNLNQNLIDGNVIILVDGLDELRNSEKITIALSKIKIFQKKYEKARTIVTSRLLEMFASTDVLSGANVLDILPFSNEQMSKFVVNWFGKESDTGKKLTKIVNEPSGLHGLPSTPLTLAIVSILFESGTKEVPANVTELFQQYTELVLGRWDVSKDIGHKIEWRIKQFVLANISWKLHNKKSLSMTINELKDEVCLFANERGLPLDVDIFAEEVIQRSELILHHGTGDYEFRHRSFQDYFCGIEISNRSDKLEIVSDKFIDPWWTQSIFFACGLNPQNESVLDNIISHAIPPKDDILKYAVALGEVSQAVYAASKGTKERVVNRVLDLILEAWNETCSRFEAEVEDRDEIAREVPPQILLLFPFTLFTQQAIGSITLSSALENIAEKLLKNFENNLIAENTILFEWRTYFTAVSALNCGRADIFASLFKSGIIQDPSLLLGGLLFSDMVKDSGWLDKDSLLKLSDLRKRLNKKLKQKDNKRYFQDLMRRGPILLPDLTNK